MSRRVVATGSVDGRPYSDDFKVKDHATAKRSEARNVNGKDWYLAPDDVAAFDYLAAAGFEMKVVKVKEMGWLGKVVEGLNLAVAVPVGLFKMATNQTPKAKP